MKHNLEYYSTLGWWGLIGTFCCSVLSHFVNPIFKDTFVGLACLFITFQLVTFIVALNHYNENKNSRGQRSKR